MAKRISARGPSSSGPNEIVPVKPGYGTTGPGANDSYAKNKPPIPPELPKVLGATPPTAPSFPGLNKGGKGKASVGKY